MGAGWIVGVVSTPIGTLADSLHLGVFCTDELRTEYAQPPSPFQVGMSYVTGARMSTCGGLVGLEDEFTWSVSDSSVITLDPGTSYLFAKGRVHGYGAVQLITVIP